MRTLETIIDLGNGSAASISHEERRVVEPAAPGSLVISSPEQNNTLTSVARAGLDFRVLVHWSCSASSDFHVLLVPETRVLFIGAGQLAAVISIPGRELIRQAAPFLFWSFERLDECVVEYGELECRLYDLGGTMLGCAAVDPPYEVEHKPTGIRFNSIVAGPTWLHFPTRRTT